jgi:hypothetical protein
VIPEINGDSIDARDRMISAGSPTTTALCLLLHILGEVRHRVRQHDHGARLHLGPGAAGLRGSDYRRSRSAPKNIIPNGHEAGQLAGHVLPAFAGKIHTSALNVPVQEGCLLDTTLVLDRDDVTAEDINEAMREGAARFPGSVAVVEDPIVSSDVLGSDLSLLFDARARSRPVITSSRPWAGTRPAATRRACSTWRVSMPNSTRRRRRNEHDARLQSTASAASAAPYFASSKSATIWRSWRQRPLSITTRCATCSTTTRSWARFPMPWRWRMTSW